MVIFKFRNLNTGQAMPVPPGEYLVGRDDDVHVHLEDASASRRHAKVFNLDDGFYIEDIGSANGTAVHGAYITIRTKLNFGDVVHIGSVPFRVDPEIAGEVEESPAGTRPANRAYMKRNTERLPLPGEMPRVVETIAQDRLAAPDVSLANDIDAEELNAVTMREPAPQEQRRLPTVHPGMTALPKASSPPSHLSAPTPQSAALPRRQNEPWPVAPQASLAAQALADTPKITLPASTISEKAKTVSLSGVPAVPLPIQPASVEPTEKGTAWGWLVVLFLAGLGTGLLLGLYFAKLFIEMGGKVAALP